MAEKTMRPASTAIGYLRVSMPNQNLEKNKADILQLADQHNLRRLRFAGEMASGKVFCQERKIAEALESLRPNEVIVVNELSRLGRSMLEWMETLSIDVQKQTNVYAVKGFWRIDQSIQSKFLAMAFSMAPKSNAISFRNGPRTLCALRRAQGLKLGRPIGSDKSKLDPYRHEIDGLLANGSIQKFIARRFRARRPTFTVSSKNRG